MIAAMILSAGASSRMERPKRLLTLGTKTFLRHCADELSAAGIRETAIVLGAGCDAIRAELGWFEGRLVLNDAWEAGQLSSIVAGIDALERTGCNGVLIWPVDHPLVSSALIRELAGAFGISPNPIVVPTFHGRRGHPIIIPRALFAEVRSAPAGVGLRSVVHAHEAEIRGVPTEEAGVRINIDTPEDYIRYAAGVK